MSEHDILDPEQRIKELEAQIEALIADRARLSAAHRLLKSEHDQLQQAGKALEARVSELEADLASLRQQRPSLPLERLGVQLKEALSAVQSAPSPEGSTLEYAVHNAQIEVKTVLDFDSEGKPLLRFPTPGERIDPGRLTTLNLAFDGIAKPEIDLSGLVQVPTLLGLTLEAAGTRLARLGLKTGKISRQESLLAVGTVIAQDPESGVFISAETLVDLTLAIPMKVEVPGLVGLSLEEAKKRLEAVHLQPGDVTVKESDKPAGSVLSQSPKAGRRVEAQTAVDLVISHGPKKIQVPALQGRQLAEAREMLGKLGLKVGTVHQQRSDQPAGIILSQKPAARSPVLLGSAVDLWVARTVIDRALPAPNLVRLERAEAIGQLRESGWSFTLSASKSADLDADRAAGWFDRVIAQSPESGEPVPGMKKMIRLEILAAPDPVEDVHGVGSRYADRLALVNITTVGDLALANPEPVVQALDISESIAKGLIAEASDLNDAVHLEGIEALSRGAALLLVKGAGLRTPQALSRQNAAQLIRKLQAVSRQEMPAIVRNVQLNRRLVDTWIETARAFVQRL